MKVIVGRIHRQRLVVGQIRATHGESGGFTSDNEDAVNWRHRDIFNRSNREKVASIVRRLLIIARV